MDQRDALDAAELALAVQELYNKLDEMMGGTGKLPIIKEDVKTILAKYDADNSGCLDRAEFLALRKFRQQAKGD